MSENSVLGIDTNVLVRWLMSDPTSVHQSALAAAAIDNATEEVLISPVVLAEFSWVAERSFGLGRQALCTLLSDILDSTMIVIPARDLVKSAIKNYGAGGPGFADHLIAAMNQSYGCTTTLTFDKSAARSPHFTLLA